MKEICEKIQRYISETYINPKLQISPLQIEQLAWSYNNPNVTQEMSLLVKEPAFIEIRRALSRLYCLQLLRNGSAKSWEKFVEAQKETGVGQQLVLTSEHFDHLSSIIRKNSDAAHRALITSTIVSSTYSETSKKLAKERLGDFPIDSVEFLYFTAQNAADIYPIVNTLTDEEATTFKFAFPSNTHFRHMMYTEGGKGMFENLCAGIRNGTIKQETVDFWYCHWMINITGFRGHIHSKGSLYLNENTYQVMTVLKSMLDKLLFNPEYPVLNDYLEYRAQMLGLDKSSPSRLVMAHIGSMLRLHTPQEGRELLEGFSEIDEKIQKEIIEQYTRTLTCVEPTPTYSPALFANFLEATKKTNSGIANIKQTIKICLPIYEKAYSVYRELLKEGKINVPLNFNKASSLDSINSILNITNMNDCNVNIDGTTGAVAFQKLSPSNALNLVQSSSPTFTPMADLLASNEDAHQASATSNVKPTSSDKKAMKL